MKFFEVIILIFFSIQFSYAEDSSSLNLFLRPEGDRVFSLQDYANNPDDFSNLSFGVQSNDFLVPLDERSYLSFSGDNGGFLTKSCQDLYSESVSSEMRNILFASCSIGSGSARREEILDFNRVINSATNGDAIFDPTCAYCSGVFADFTESIPEKSAEPGKYHVPDISNEEACNIEGMSEQAKLNCTKIFEEGKVPKSAFMFALDGPRRNASSFETNKCWDTYEGKEGDNKTDANLEKRMRTKHPSMGKMRELSDFSGLLEEGIPNKCTMIINDYDDRIETHSGAFECKTAMFYIDMCADEPKVTKTYSYVGHGTCKNKKKLDSLKENPFLNKSNHGTSLLGFSVTGPNSFAFGSQSKAYKRIRKNLGGRVPATPLFGFQNTNNGAAVDFKYLHVGAYTSAGCPSIDPKYANWVDDLAAKGPSIVVGYKEGEMEAFEGCE